MTFTDPFTRADSSVLGADWQEFPGGDAPDATEGGGDLRILSSALALAKSADRLAHGCSTSDSFNRADSASLGLTDQAYSGSNELDRFWPNFQDGSWGITSNQAAPQSSTARGLSAVNSGVGGNLILECTLAVVVQGAGLLWRASDSSNYWSIRQGAGSASVVKRVAGVETTVATVGSLVSGDVVRVVLDGNNHSVSVNGSEVAAYADSALATNSSCGLFADSTTTPRFDGFKVAALEETYAGGFARAEHDVGSLAMYAQAEFSFELDGGSFNTYPIAFLGCALDPSVASLDAADFYSGPSGIWLDYEPLFDYPSSAGAAVYAYNSATDEFEYLSSGGFGAYFSLPLLGPGDVLRLEVDQVAGTFSVLINGAVQHTESYSLAGMATPPALGERGGCGLQSFWASEYIDGSDLLDSYEQGALVPVEPPAPPKLRATRFTTPEHLKREVGDVLIGSRGRQWNEPISEPGLGALVLANDRAQPNIRDFIAFDVHGVRAWVMIAEELARVDLSPESLRVKETSTWKGRGHLAVMEDGLVYPELGLSSWPKQLDMHYDWRHKDYPRGLLEPWPNATRMCSLIEAQFPGVWNHNPAVPWSQSIPGGTLTDVMWASSGTLDTAPIGKCYVERTLSLPWTGTYAMWFACDNRGLAFMDDAAIGAAGFAGQLPDTAGWGEDQQVIWVAASEGTHTLTLEVENIPRSDVFTDRNPGGYVWNIWIPGIPPTFLAASSTADIICEYPPEPPGMTPGMAIRLALEQVQGRGALQYVTLGFDDYRDTAGVLWASRPCISTKILNDLLILLTEISATYADIRMDPSSFELRAWNIGTMGSGSVIDFRRSSGNLNSLEQHVSGRIANVVVGNYQDQYLEARNDPSIAVHGRIEAELSIGSVDTVEEARRVLVAALSTYALPQEEISAGVARAEAPIGYVHYGHGDRLTTNDHRGDEVVERCVGIAISEDDSNGDVISVPSMKQVVA